MTPDASADSPIARIEISDHTGNRAVPLREPITRLGRAVDNHVQMTDGRISKHHAEITRDGADFVLRDVGSKAGVFCNGNQVQEHRLRDGDVIKLGKASSVRVVFRTAATDSKSHESALAMAFSDTNLGPLGAKPSSPGPKTEIARETAGLQNLARFLELSRTLSGHLSPDEVVNSVVDMAIEMTGAERGFVVLAGDDGELEFAVVRGRDAEVSKAAPAISETIVRQVLAEKQPRVVSNVSMDDQLKIAQSVMNLRLGSVAAIPLWRYVMPDRSERAQATDEVFGALCLDSQQSRKAFDEVDLGILESLAYNASSAIENARLMRDGEEKRRIEAELERAREVQSALVPEKYWNAPYFDIAGAYVPCLDLAGDFLGQFRRGDGTAAFAVADVCGKGVHAALLAAALQGALMAELRKADPLAQVVGLVNDVIEQIAPDGKFISMLCCSLAANGTLRFVNAGHGPLIVIREDKVEQIEIGGLALGLIDEFTYQEKTVQLAPGDTVILCTDGVLEAMNPERETFGEQRLVDAVRGMHGQPAQAICDRLLQAIESFCGGTVLDDDTTLMVIGYRDPSAK